MLHCNIYLSTRFLAVGLGIISLTTDCGFNSSIAAKPAIIGSAMYIHRRMLLASCSIIASTKRTIAQMIEFLLIEFMLMPPKCFDIIISEIIIPCINNEFIE